MIKAIGIALCSMVSVMMLWCFLSVVTIGVAVSAVGIMLFFLVVDAWFEWDGF